MQIDLAARMYNLCAVFHLTKPIGSHTDIESEH